MYNVLYDRVLLKKIEVEKVSAGGIVLHTRPEDATHEAEVIAVGNGKKRKNKPPLPLDVKVGDRVVYNPNTVIEIQFKGEELLVIREDEIYAIVEVQNDLT
jgi:chaperonin GroES